MKHVIVAILILVVAAASVLAASPLVGAAPNGDATAVATRIIKYNFPFCKRVSGATRMPDGSIRAMCDGASYLVFTVLDGKEGRIIEVALNCAAAKNVLNVSC